MRKKQLIIIGALVVTLITISILAKLLSDKEEVVDDDFPTNKTINATDRILGVGVTGNLLDVILYDEVCYYGLAMTWEIDETDEVNGWEKIGNFNGIIKRGTIPVNELTASIRLTEDGCEIYHYTDNSGKHYFCAPTERNGFYYGINAATTEQPYYYPWEE